MIEKEFNGHCGRCVRPSFIINSLKVEIGEDLEEGFIF